MPGAAPLRASPRRQYLSLSAALFGFSTYVEPVVFCALPAAITMPSRSTGGGCESLILDALPRVSECPMREESDIGEQSLISLSRRPGRGRRPFCCFQRRPWPTVQLRRATNSVRGSRKSRSGSLPAALQAALSRTPFAGRRASRGG